MKTFQTPSPHEIAGFIEIGEAIELFGHQGRNAFLLAMQMQDRNAFLPAANEFDVEDRDNDYFARDTTGFDLGTLTLAGLT